MKWIRRVLRKFFFPPPGSSRWRRLLPYLTLGALTLIVFVLAVFTWDYTNSAEFCGTTCHLMPPEYTSYLISPHARVACVECHMSEGYTVVKAFRKAGEIKHIVSLLFRRYEFPVRAEAMTPARESCEQCHFPEKFSDDSLREIRHFNGDGDNTPISIYLTLKTGGGTKREGLGRGIHWHIENPVYYLALDEHEQEIPYIRWLQDDGTVVEYLDVEAKIDPAEINPEDLQLMDCISCHNRITHLIYQPEDAVEQLMFRGIISPAIPEIRNKAVEVLRMPYNSVEIALNGIAGLTGYYVTYYPDFYAAHDDDVEAAVTALQDYYQQSVFPEQNTDWDSHPNEIGHVYSPGCFRCHDGKHLNAQQESIRLECNICHSIPIVAGPSDLVANVEISRGPEPQSHFHPNFLALHRDYFDATCANCHTTDNPGGSDDSSFCANSSCHGTKWVYADLDAPGLREIFEAQLPPPATPVPTPPTEEGPLTYDDTIGPLLQVRCAVCHGANPIKGFDVTTYAALLAGGEDGPGFVPGDVEASLLATVQLAGNHPGQLNEEELALIIEWIEAGAPEK